MKSEYIEHEIKVLNVNIEQVIEKLEELGAKKVYDDERKFIVLDNENGDYLKQDKLIRVTEEGTTKVSIHINNSKPEIKEAIKYKASRTKEQLDFFKAIGLNPIAKAKARRISYELGDIDFDIDDFYKIPPFLEIDLENVEDEKELLKKLGLENNEVVRMGTEAIFEHYGLNYFEEYKV